MSITLLVPLPLQRYSDGRRELVLEGSTVDEVLGHLFGELPSLRPRVLDAEGELFPYLQLFHNGKQLAALEMGATALEAGDTLDLIGAVEGGSSPPSPARGTDVRMRGFRERASVEAARTAALQGLAPLETDSVPVSASAGRVLAEGVESPVDVPPFDRSAMDGYAVQAGDTFGATLYDPVELELVGECLPGAGSDHRVGPGQACRIMTGARIPEGADAVLVAEEAEEPEKKAGVVLARGSVTPSKNVGKRGEDIAEGEEILASGRWLRPQDTGLLASIGCTEVPVRRRPRVHILVTGSELLPPGAMPEQGKIVDSNTPMLEALVERDGGEVVSTARLVDDRELIRAELESPGADVILAAGGSSVGREDWMPLLVRELGELPIHGVAMRPSAPAGIGTLGETRVFLLPGNPVSCLCAYDFFAGPALRTLAGLDPAWPYSSMELPLARRLSSRVGRLDYVRVRVRDGAAEPLAISGASILSSTTRAEGFAVVPADSEGMAEGESLRVFLYEPRPLHLPHPS